MQENSDSIPYVHASSHTVAAGLAQHSVLLKSKLLLHKSILQAFRHKLLALIRKGV